MTRTPRRVLLIGPNHSGRRSLVGGLQRAIKDLNGYEPIDGTNDADSLAERLTDEGLFPENHHDAAHQFRVYRVSYVRKSGLFDRNVEVLVPYDPGLLGKIADAVPEVEGSNRSFLRSLRAAGLLDRQNQITELVDDISDCALEREYATLVAELATRVDEIACVVPLDDFWRPAIGADSVPSQLRPRLLAGDSGSDPTEAALNRGFPQYNNPKYETARGSFFDIGHPDRAAPSTYLDAYSKLAVADATPDRFRTIVTMGDLAFDHYSSHIVDTPRTPNHSKPDEFAEFLCDKYLTAEACYEELSVVPESKDLLGGERVQVAWYQLESITPESGIELTQPTPLHGAKGLLDSLGS